MRKIHRITGIGAVLLAAAIAIPSGGAIASAVAASGHAAAKHGDSAPCEVTGYSDKAKAGIDDNGIDEGDVKETVSAFCASAIKQEDGTWLYRAGGRTVIVDSSGQVISAAW
jgi:hypothetical protein